jgi:hypothetical protein
VGEKPNNLLENMFRLIPVLTGIFFSGRSKKPPDTIYFCIHSFSFTLILNMKHINNMKAFLVATLVLAGSSSFAQSFGIHAGGNLASATVKSGGSLFPIAPESKLGFLAGLVAEIPIAKSVNFRPELNFIQKGYKISFSEDFGTGTFAFDGKETLNYLELPLNVTYSLPAGSNTVFLGAGPSIGLGLSGKSKLTSTQPGQPTTTEEEDTKFGGDENEDDYKPLDLGLNILGGFRFTNGLFLKLGYTFGLSNLTHEPESSYKNKGFAFSVGYFFSKASK